MKPGGGSSPHAGRSPPLSPVVVVGSPPVVELPPPLSVVVGVMVGLIDSPWVALPSVVPLALAVPVEVPAVVSDVLAALVGPALAEALALSRASSPQAASMRERIRGKRSRLGAHTRRG